MEKPEQGLEPRAWLKDRTAVAGRGAPSEIVKRLSRSPVVWSWAMQGFKLGSGIIILPLLLRVLSTADLGIYYVFISLYALGPLMDFGFLPTISRSVGFAMGGSK